MSQIGPGGKRIELVRIGFEIQQCRKFRVRERKMEEREKDGGERIQELFVRIVHIFKVLNLKFESLIFSKHLVLNPCTSSGDQ